MIHFVLNFIVIVGAITLLGLILTSIAPFVDESNASRVRAKVESFWFSIALLDTPQQVGRTLRVLGAQMRTAIPTFMKAFWIFLFAMFLVVCYENSSSTVDKDFNTELTSDFNFILRTYYAELGSPGDLFCKAHPSVCTKYEDNGWRKELSRVEVLEDSYHDLINDLNKNHSLLLVLLADLSALLAIIGLAIPLSASLFVSFHLTLWLLSIVTSSRIKLLLIFMLDIFVAFLLPIVLLNIALIISGFAMVFMGGGLWDFTGFTKATYLSLVLGRSLYDLDIVFALQILPAYVVYSFYSLLTLIVTIVALVWLFITILVPNRLVSFIGDTWKVLHLDFSPSFLDGVVNWAIIVDLSYSFTFIGVALTLVFLQRWSAGRGIVLNMAQTAAEHPKGPIFAIGAGLSWLAAAIRTLFHGSLRILVQSARATTPEPGAAGRRAARTTPIY
jgi:hypothetical protein